MSEDIFDLPDDDEETPAQKPRNNEAAALRKMEKDMKALSTELEELRTFKVEREKQDRGNAVTSAFQELGLNPKHAKFYSGEGDVTVDAIKAWAVAEDFLTVSEDEAAPEAPQPGFTPTVIEGSQAPGSKIYEFDEWMKLSQSDPTRAQQLWKAGRVADAIRD
jgi:hypothetical protein